MKTLILTLTILVICLGCEKQNDAKSINGDWALIYLEEEDGSQVQIEQVLEVTIEDDHRIAFNTSANSCSSTFTIDEVGNFNLATIPCTYRCCDMLFEIRFMKLLVEMNRYELNRNKLLMSGDGSIELTKIDK